MDKFSRKKKSNSKLMSLPHFAKNQPDSIYGYSIILRSVFETNGSVLQEHTYDQNINYSLFLGFLITMLSFVIVTNSLSTSIKCLSNGIM